MARAARSRVARARDHRPGLRRSNRSGTPRSVAEPSGVPSSNQARRYHSPSHASRSSAACSAPACARQVAARAVSPRASASGAKSLERRVEQPAEPDALALAQFADAVHAVVPVAGADQRQAVRRRPRGWHRGRARSARTACRPRRRPSAGRSCHARRPAEAALPGTEPPRPAPRHRRSRAT